MAQTKEEIAQLKEKYIEYYRDLPVQKYAAMYIGRNEDTIIIWMKKDSDFSYRVQEARSQWVRRKASKVKAEFALERLEKDAFAQRIEQKVDEDTVDKILEGFGLNDPKTKSPKKSSSKE